jgi:hypothetical protein
MAKTKRNNRNSTRRSTGLFGVLWAPFHHFFMATGESVSAVGTSAGDIVKKGIDTVDTVGTTYARHAKQMVNNISGRSRTRRGRRRRQGKN